MTRKTKIVLAAVILVTVAVLVFAQNMGQFGGTTVPQVFAWVGGIPGDPCQTSVLPKTAVPINITTATTTQLVAPSGTTTVYVCGGSFTINSVVTTATTAQFIGGTGGTCGTLTANLTGLFNAGNVTAGTAVSISLSDPGTSFNTAAGSGLCLVSAGTTVQIQGVLQEIQR